MDMKRYFLYFITIAALTLAGCGGGGGAPPTTIPPDTTTPPDTTCGAGEELNPDTNMCQAITPVGSTDEKIAAATKAADTKLTAIGVEAMQSTEGGIGGNDDDGNAITTTTLAITRDSDGTEVKITDSTMDGDDDKKFATVMPNPGILAEANGFAGTMNVRTMEADDDGNVEQEVVVVRTDIKAPTARPFVLDGDNKGVYALDANNNDDNEPQSLEIDGNNFGMMMSDAFVSGGGPTTVLTFVAAVEDNANTADVDETVKAFETMATFDGAMGTLTCGGSTDCTVTLNEKGEVTDVRGDWHFTPEMGAKVDVADTSYLAYGFWLKRTTKDGQTTYNEVEAFTEANEVDESTGSEIALVQGDATYMGNSTGVYVKHVTDNTGAVQTSTSGLYSADVTLTATFGGDDIGVNKQFLIEGEVTNFDLQHGEDNDWGVKLESADFSGRTGNEGPAESNIVNNFSGDTTGDSTADDGAWNGTFYGATPATEAIDDGTATVAPPSVLGEFNAYFTDGAALGGFGAHKQ